MDEKLPDFMGGLARKRATVYADEDEALYDLISSELIARDLPFDETVKGTLLQQEDNTYALEQDGFFFPLGEDHNLRTACSNRLQISKLVLPINHGNNHWTLAEYNRKTGEIRHADSASVLDEDNVHSERARDVLSNVFNRDWPARIIWSDQRYEYARVHERQDEYERDDFSEPFVRQQEDGFACGRHMLGTAAGIQDRRNGANVDFQLEDSVPFELITLRKHLAFSMLCDEINSSDPRLSLRPVRHDLCTFEVHTVPSLQENNDDKLLAIFNKTEPRTYIETPSGDGLRLSSGRIEAANIGAKIGDFAKFFERSNHVKQSRISGYEHSGVSLSGSVLPGESAAADSFVFSRDIAPSSLYDVGTFYDAEPSDWRRYYEPGVRATDTPAVPTGEPGTYYDAESRAWEDEHDDDIMGEPSNWEIDKSEYPELGVQGGYGTELSPLSGTMGGVDWTMAHDTSGHPQQPAFEELRPSHSMQEPPIDPRLFQESAGIVQPSSPGLGVQKNAEGPPPSPTQLRSLDAAKLAKPPSPRGDQVRAGMGAQYTGRP